MKSINIKGEQIGYDYLSKYFDYNPNTGEIRHKFIQAADLPKGFKHSVEAWNRRKAYKRAELRSGCGNNYYTFRVYVYLNDYKGQKFLLAHRVAWLLHYKEWPRGEIDHIDGDPFNNKIENLRDCGDSTINQRNMRPIKTRKFPRGVRFTLSGGAKTPTFKAWYRNDDGKDAQLYCGRDYFEACCARKSWENEMLKNPVNGYTRRHFGRE